MKINLKPTKFTKGQINRLANIACDLGVVMFASVVLPSIFDKINLLATILGCLGSFLFFITSLKLEKIVSYLYF